jgi:NitT/TauT family transport system substrate-binding protein
VQDYADLRGRKVALAARGISAEVVLAKALERGGLTINDVDIVELSYPDIVVGLATGAIEIGVTPQPYPLIAAQRGVGQKWRGTTDVIENQVASTMMYSAQFIEQRPDIARDFMVVFLLGAREYNDAFVKKLPTTQEQAYDALVRRTDMRDVDLLRQFDASMMDPNGRLSKAALNTDYQWFREYGGLTEEIDFDRIVDPSFADYAVSVLGPYR